MKHGNIAKNYYLTKERLKLWLGARDVRSQFNEIPRTRNFKEKVVYNLIEKRDSFCSPERDYRTKSPLTNSRVALAKAT